MLLLLVRLRAVLLLQLGVERGDVAVDRVPGVDVLLVREPVLCDRRKTGASRLVRREYDSQLALRVPQRRRYRVIDRLRVVGLRGAREGTQRSPRES